MDEIGIEIYISTIALLVSFVSLGVAIYANRHSKKSNEIILCQELLNQKGKLLEYLHKWDNGEIEEGIFNSAIASYLNAYELYCGACLRNEIDKRNFKIYAEEDIKRIVESAAYKKVLGDESISYYTQIWKAYRELREG